MRNKLYNKIYGGNIRPDRYDIAGTVNPNYGKYANVEDADAVINTTKDATTPIDYSNATDYSGVVAMGANIGEAGLRTIPEKNIGNGLSVETRGSAIGRGALKGGAMVTPLALSLAAPTGGLSLAAIPIAAGIGATVNGIQNNNQRKDTFKDYYNLEQQKINSQPKLSTYGSIGNNNYGDEGEAETTMISGDLIHAPEMGGYFKRKRR